MILFEELTSEQHYNQMNIIMEHINATFNSEAGNVTPELFIVMIAMMVDTYAAGHNWTIEDIQEMYDNLKQVTKAVHEELGPYQK